MQSLYATMMLGKEKVINGASITVTTARLGRSMGHYESNKLSR